MKNILFLLLFITSFPGFSQINKSQLKGTWKLDSVVTSSGVAMRGNVDYYLTFNDSTISFNKAVNTCTAKYRLTPADSLKITGTGCTKICCDEEQDFLSIYITYDGRLKMKNGNLIVNNQNGAIYLHKK